MDDCICSKTFIKKIRENRYYAALCPLKRPGVCIKNVLSFIFFWANKQCLIKEYFLPLYLMHNTATSKPEVGAKVIFSLPPLSSSWSVVRYCWFARNTQTWQQVPGTGGRLNF